MMMWSEHPRHYSKFCSTHKIQILNTSNLMEEKIYPKNDGWFRVLECHLKNISYKMCKNFVEWHNKFPVHLESI